MSTNTPTRLKDCRTALQVYVYYRYVCKYLPHGAAISTIMYWDDSTTSAKYRIGQVKSYNRMRKFA